MSEHQLWSAEASVEELTNHLRSWHGFDSPADVTAWHILDHERNGWENHPWPD